MNKQRPRRVRREPPKVWHNPAVVGGASHEQEAPTKVAAPAKAAARSARIVTARTDARDEKELLLERLVERLGAAEGRAAITKIVGEIEELGLSVPENHQIAHLQLLEHSAEPRVRASIARLAAILDKEPSKRGAVLESRLRRLEEFADDSETRAAAAELRRRIKAVGAP
jgi:hypothetical protein